MGIKGEVLNDAASAEAFRARPNRILTERTEIFPATLDEFASRLIDPSAFAEATRLSSPPAPWDDETRAAMNWLYELGLSLDADSLVWGTSWQIVDRAENVVVGSVCFKGPPDENGNVEIGYGVEPGRGGRGYMSEAVGAFVAWARTRPDVAGIVAETLETNVASRRVLEKNGFRFDRATDDSLFWRVDVRGDEGEIESTVKLDR